MASQLLKKTEVYRVDTEEEAMSMIEDAKDGQMNGGYTLTKSSYVLKTKKSKGEIVDQWFICQVALNICRAASWKTSRNTTVACTSVLYLSAANGQRCKRC